MLAKKAFFPPQLKSTIHDKLTLKYIKLIVNGSPPYEGGVSGGK